MAPGNDAALLAARATLESIVSEQTAKLNGSISAEHGLGLAKNAAIARPLPTGNFYPVLRYLPQRI